MQVIEPRTLDNRRRLVMPDSLPAGATVNVQQLDAETWLIKLARPVADYKVVLIPAIDRLPDDAEWQAKELEAARGLAENMPGFES